MPSESLAASWHPALMPNSVADIIQTKSMQSSHPSPLSSTEHHPEEPLAVQESHSSEFLSRDSEISNGIPAGSAVESIQDEQPELNDLRNALTASLASPGGVEMDESPSHNGISRREEIGDDVADFPSEGPSHANKHMSTMSFARTVSEEVNWGEDDEVDPEWNLSRTDTDPFKFMDKTERTNSFPVIPATHQVGELLPTQVEQIMNEVEHESQDLFGDEGGNEEADFFSQRAVPDTTAANFADFGNVIQGHTNEHFGQSSGGDARQEQDFESEAQFEEGLHLIQHDDSDDGDDFFSKARKSDDTAEESWEPQPLDRKSTMQVLNSLDYEPHQQNQDDIPEEDSDVEVGIEKSQSSLDRAAGDGIAISTNTILSEVLENPNTDIHSQPENLASLEMDTGEGDLAAKWKAALAGDEFLDDDDELLDDDDAAEGSTALDPSALFGSDDEGFLEDTEQFVPELTPHPSQAPNGHAIGTSSGSAPSNRPSSSSNRYLPAGATANVVAPPATKNYAPTAPLLTDLSRPATTPVVAPSPYIAPAMGNFAPPQQERPSMPKAQSFADKSKGGYASPYDLPMEVVKPRKRPSMQHLNPTPAAVPPPRSTSMYAQGAPPTQATSGLSPPTSSHGPQQNSTPPSRLPSSQPPNTTAKSQTHGFFEELPMSTKPKLAPRHSGGFTPHMAPAPPQLPPPAGQAPYASPIQHQPPQAPAHQAGLVAPERVSPYASLPSGHVPPPAIASRYSPAPTLPQSHTAPPPASQSRYSPAPPPPQQQQHSYNPPVNAPPPMLPHQPRTSSPLAHFERSQDQRSYSSEMLSYDRRTSSSGHESSLRASHLPPTREVDENEPALSPTTTRNYGELQMQNTQQAMRPATRTPPPHMLGSQMAMSPPKRGASNYLPQPVNNNTYPSQNFEPPQRSHTQSPGTAFRGPKLDMTNSVPYKRPASVEVPTSPRNSIHVTSIQSMQSMQAAPTQGRPRGFSHGYNYIAPVDGREHDPLQRWKGAPVFAWGVGGTIITSFPKDVPRYMASQPAPMIIRSPGEVKISNIKEVNPLPERLTSFPGPLKGKSKKKEVVTWLSSGIDILEQEGSYLRSLSFLTHEDKRTEERILLWKILRVFIENDGTLEGNASVDKAVREVLSPGIDDETSNPLYATGADLSGIVPSVNAPRSDPVDPAAVDQLRRHLLRGDREKAVWEAVDKRLWAHAMLIANTVSRDLYKQVAQEFVQKEVKTAGENTESLAALYDIFAGNFEESIDELVPPSARAGFQMVSTTNTGGASKDAMDGLDRWRETLGLVLSNRSVDDIQALNALGKLLSGYGRAEAAHICFLFARHLSIFGGVDDPTASIVLVGSDHLRQPYEFDREMEPILLSEVFEYGMSISNVSNIPVSSPHLAIYKLQHATILAEFGYREKALQYCESIASSITSQTRRSPYHHSLLVAELDDLSKRLKQSPKAETSSWVSKPSIDKIGNSVWDKLSKFVAGDENEPSAPGSAGGSATDIGPFSRIAGGTPTISRSPSNSELYGSYNGGLGINGGMTAAPATKASSRYAPGRTYTPEPRTGSYSSQPRTSLEGRSSDEHSRYEPQRQMSDYRPDAQPILGNNSYAPQSSYAPQTSNGPAYAPLTTPITEQPPTNLYSSPQPSTSFDGQQASNPYAPASQSYEIQQPSSFNTPSSGYEPLNSGYEPPTSGYEPPSYEPATMDDEPDSPIETRPKKKSFMDDDDDDIPTLKQAPGTREKTKAEKDREADEAFRKAAEADAQKAAAAPAKKGWGLGGWFGGGKKESQDVSQPNKPIKAKLGEASSFYYDPELKRWVNKKGGDTAPTPTATPPPPKATGPPRTASGPPMSGATSVPKVPPTMRASSDSGKSFGRASPTPSETGSLAPPSTTAGPTPMMRSASNGSAAGGPPSAPPSRPGTGMSNASSIDDLLGPASGTVRKGGKGKKKGRGYIDVMGDKAS
ncbi:Sec23-binding domain of Sec16-domain-containing protein [Tricladium varicosporioides]|nr:Sec23-binding domain of Sec16-domain-containing protein [Hymenoscyphus varicosporioides]